MRAEWVFVALVVLIVLALVAAVWLPAEASAAGDLACPWWWVYVPQLRAPSEVLPAEGGDPADPPISEDHSIGAPFRVLLPFVGVRV